VQWQVPTAELTALLLASVRAAAWLVIAPPFAGRSLPGPVKGLLSMAIALPMVPQLVGKVPELGTGQLLVSLVEQVVVGVSLGFLTALFFAAVQAAGGLIDLFAGFSVAFAFDPFSQAGNSVFGRFYNLMAITLLFATGGHQLVLRGFATSYKTLPLDGTLSMSTMAELVTTGMTQMFVAAVQIAAPLLAVLICADLGLGLLNRVAPALNAFSLGFPLKILLSLVVAGAGVTLLPGAVARIVELSVNAVVKAAGG